MSKTTDNKQTHTPDELARLYGKGRAATWGKHPDDDGHGAGCPFPRGCNCHKDAFRAAREESEAEERGVTVEAVRAHKAWTHAR